MKIGIIAGDPEVQDSFSQSSRNWLKNIENSHITAEKPEIWKKVIRKS